MSKHRRRERSNEVQNSPSPKQSENSWLPIHVTHTLKRILSQFQEQRISVQKEYRVRERWKHKKRIPKRPYSLKMGFPFPNARIIATPFLHLANVYRTIFMHNCTQHCLPYISKRKRELIRALSCLKCAGTRHFPPLHTRAGPSKNENRISP